MTKTFIFDDHDDIFNGIGIEVALLGPESFPRIRETLTRIGFVRKSRVENEPASLIQNCYILHKRGRYVIAHYKELMFLDGADVEMSDDEVAIRNSVVSLLHKWKLLKVLEPDDIRNTRPPGSALKVLPFREKNRWNLVSPYQIGVKKTGKMDDQHA